MKRKAVVWMIVLSVFLLILAGVGYWQRNNLTAIYYAVKYDKEQQQEQVQKADQKIQELSRQYADIDFSKLPEEATKMLVEGTISQEVAVAVLKGDVSWEEVKENPEAVTEQLKNKQQVDTTPENSQAVEDIIARIYVLRSSYVGRLEGLVPVAWKEYISKKGTKSEIIAKYLAIGSSLEAECDGEMEALLAQLEAELRRTGGDLSLVSEIRGTYQREKSLKKAEMIQKYQN